MLQDIPKDVEDGDLVARYHERVTPNAYTALVPYMIGAAQMDEEAPNLHPVASFGGNLLVSRPTAGTIGAPSPLPATSFMPAQTCAAIRRPALLRCRGYIAGRLHSRP
jgi:hypothetical protein